MMELKKQVCSLDLAKRLEELGVSQKSSFVWCADDIWFRTPLDGSREDGARISSRTLNDNAQFAAFTAAELGEMFPIQWMGTTRTDLIANPDATGRWASVYVDAHNLPHIVYADTEADARAKMFIYIIENKFIAI